MFSCHGDEAKGNLFIVVVLMVVPCRARQVVKIHPIAIAFPDELGKFVCLFKIPGALANFSALLVLLLLVVVLAHDPVRQVDRVG